MANKSVPELAVGDRLRAYGMTLQVESLKRFEKRNGFGIDCTQAKCLILAGADRIPRVYTDNEAGTHFTIQGNDLYRVATIED
jgi:hypothetical protein